LDFQGKHTLIAALDAAIGGNDLPARPGAVAAVLRASYLDPMVRLPAALKAPVDGHYARRELHLSPQLGYSVVAMAWAPGQGTPLHDHDGAWCVEGVWQGRLHVQGFDLLDHDDRYWHFRRGQACEIGLGRTGMLHPPGEHHRVHNPDPEQVAVSIHVYAHRLLRCHVYEPERGNADDGVYHRRELALATD
jgi:predicted metal-dependent enzyme (double-stranded beta helix superfamily)